MVELLIDKFNSIDMKEAKKDCVNFLTMEKQNELNLWTSEFFIQLTKDFLRLEN